MQFGSFSFLCRMATSLSLVFLCITIRHHYVLCEHCVSSNILINKHLNFTSLFYKHIDLTMRMAHNEVPLPFFLMTTVGGEY